MEIKDRIKWIKNVKRYGGIDWAYYAKEEDERFSLAFAPSQIRGADNLSKGDIVVLFQTISNRLLGPRGTYLTHLVEVDSLISERTGQEDYPVARGVKVLARAPQFKLKSRNIGLSFSGIQRGPLCNFDLFNRKKSPLENKKRIIELLTPYFVVK